MGDEACKLEGGRCLGCGQFLDGATHVGKGKDKPNPGAITVCLYCGHLMIFADDLSFRNPTSDEMYELAGNKLILKLQELRGKVMKDYKGQQQVSNVKK